MSHVFSPEFREIFKKTFFAKQLRTAASETLMVVSATFLQVCFVCLKDSTCKTGKNIFISLRKLFSFLR